MKFIAALLLLCAPIFSQTVVNTFTVPGWPQNKFVETICYDNNDQSIWVIDRVNRTVINCDKQGTFLGAFTTPVPPGSTTPITDPRAITEDPISNTLWIADDTGWVYEITKTGTLTGASWPIGGVVISVAGMTYDNSTGHFFIIQSWLSPFNLMFEFDRIGNYYGQVMLQPAGILTANSIAYNNSSDSFFIGDATSNFIVEINRFGVNLGFWSTLPLGVNPVGLTVDTRLGYLIIGNGSVLGAIDEVAGILAPPAGLWGDTGSISVNAGGTLNMIMDLSFTEAGKYYMVLGSFSQSESYSGFYWYGALVPLIVDPYFIWTYSNFNTHPIYNNAGLLDSAGQAQIQFVVDPLTDQALIGTTVTHVGITLEQVLGMIFVTNVTQPITTLLTQ